MFAPPLWFIAWGVLFHTTGAILGFHVTTKVPFIGDGAMSVFVRVIFSLATFSTVLNHVYHLVGISLEMQENIFLAGLTVLLPSQICMCRCLFLELPRNRAILWTVLNIFAITVWPNITKAAYGLDGDQPFVRGTPEYFKERGWSAPAQHFTTEIVIMLVNVFTYLQMTSVRSEKARQAETKKKKQ